VHGERNCAPSGREGLGEVQPGKTWFPRMVRGYEGQEANPVRTCTNFAQGNSVQGVAPPVQTDVVSLQTT
jgi:hypothetical protein